MAGYPQSIPGAEEMNSRSLSTVLKECLSWEPQHVSVVSTTKAEAGETCQSVGQPVKLNW